MIRGWSLLKLMRQIGAVVVVAYVLSVVGYLRKDFPEKIEVIGRHYYCWNWIQMVEPPELDLLIWEKRLHHRPMQRSVGEMRNHDHAGQRSLPLLSALMVPSYPLHLLANRSRSYPVDGWVKSRIIKLPLRLT